MYRRRNHLLDQTDAQISRKCFEKVHFVKKGRRMKTESVTSYNCHKLKIKKCFVKCFLFNY